MPIEIREMIIRADVRESNRPPALARSQTSFNKEEVIAEAVDRVMEILKRQKER
jgi:hypothetical protein